MSRTMKIAAFLSLAALASGAVELADSEDLQLRRLFRVKKDLVVPPAASPAAKTPVCVYADVSKTGTKTIVCGDPAPATLATLLEKEASAKTASAVDPAQQRQVEEKCFGKKEQPVKLYLQQQEHYVQPQVAYVQHQEPAHGYVQPQVTYVQPQVHYERPEVHYQPIVYQRPQVHVQPIVYHQPAVHQQLLKPICNDYGGGYGGYGRSAAEEDYPRTLMRTVETEHFINDVPVMRSVETAVPYVVADGAFGGAVGRTSFRPTPVPTLRSVQAADQYSGAGYYGGDVVALQDESPEYGVQPGPYSAATVDSVAERSSGRIDLVPQYAIVQIDESPRNVAAAVSPMLRPVMSPQRYDALPMAMKTMSGQHYVELGDAGGQPVKAAPVKQLQPASAAAPASKPETAKTGAEKTTKN